MADELTTKSAPATSPSGLEPAAADRMARSPRSAAQTQERLAAGLAMIAGFVDAYGIITYSTYVSFMSGNTTQTGYKVGQDALSAAAPSALAILFFVGGSFVGTLLGQFAGRQTRRLVFGVVAVGLAAVIGLMQQRFLSAGVHIATAAFSMGVMNTALSHAGTQSVSLTFVTGTLSRVGTHLALAFRRASLPDAQGLWDTHLRRALVLAGVWAGFLAGAFLSGAATPRFGAWVLLCPVLILSAMAAFDRIAGAAVSSKT